MSFQIPLENLKNGSWYQNTANLIDTSWKDDGGFIFTNLQDTINNQLCFPNTENLVVKCDLYDNSENKLWSMYPNRKK